MGSSRLVPFVLRRLRDLYGVIILEGMDRQRSEDGGKAVVKTNGRGAKPGRRGRRVRLDARGRVVHVHHRRSLVHRLSVVPLAWSGLRELNERLSGMSVTSAPVVNRATPAVQDASLMLSVLRSALLGCPEAQAEADAEGLPPLALKLWPYAITLEEGGSAYRPQASRMGGALRDLTGL